MPDPDPKMFAIVQCPATETETDPGYTSWQFTPSTIRAVPPAVNHSSSTVSFLDFYQRHIAGTRNVTTDDPAEQSAFPSLAKLSLQYPSLGPESTSRPGEVFFPLVYITGHDLKKGGEGWHRLLMRGPPARSGASGGRSGTVAWIPGYDMFDLGKGSIVSLSKGDDVRAAAVELVHSAYDELFEAAGEAIKDGEWRVVYLDT